MTTSSLTLARPVSYDTRAWADCPGCRRPYLSASPACTTVRHGAVTQQWVRRPHIDDLGRQLAQHLAERTIRNGRFRYTRSGSRSWPVEITLSWGGLLDSIDTEAGSAPYALTLEFTELGAKATVTRPSGEVDVYVVEGIPFGA